MFKTYKVMLIPNNKQKTRFFQMAGAARFAYNWTLARQKENHEQGNKFISAFSMSKEFTQFKKTEGYEWLNDISSNLTAQAIADACDAYVKFFKKLADFPKFKSRKRSKPAFANKYNAIRINETHVFLEKVSLSRKKSKQKLNAVRLAEKGRIPYGEGIKYSNPRITFDGLNWWLSVGVESEVNYYHKYTEGVGIDLGIKDLAVTSDNEVYVNINKTQTIRKLEKKKRRLQRKVSRKYQINKQGEKFVKTKNIERLEKDILRIHKRLSNIRRNYMHNITTSIVNRKPRFIAMEDLNVKGMMKNRHLSKAVAQQNFYEFRRIMEYKCAWHEIEFILVDRFFPSSKMCVKCGNVKKDLKLSDRVYKCECGNAIDRDYQAALNLKVYGERELASKSVT